MSRRLRDAGDEGNALLEFTYLAVLLMVPLVYVLLAVFTVQRAAFGVTEAARQAGRAFVLADDPSSGMAAATAAATLALGDQGLSGGATPSVVCSATDAGGCTRVRVTVTRFVSLPLVGAVLPQGNGGISVTGVHSTGFDRFRERRS